MTSAAWERAASLGAVVTYLDGAGAARPFAVKELIAVAGVPTTASSHADDATPPAAYDAVCVALLRAAGWAPVATTRTHEHAWGITTRHPDGSGAANPHDPRRITGGSSGGSAVAVAVGAVDLALGTDTAGSVRIPAAFCGVLGLKVTWGAVPTTGCRPLAPSLDTVGVLARDVATAADALRAWQVPVEHDGPLRVGVVQVEGAPRLLPQGARALDRAAGRLGATASVGWPDAVSTAESFYDLQAAEALAVHRDVLGTWPARADRYGADVAARLRAAQERVPDPRAQERRAALRAETLAAFDGLDVLVLPVSACAPGWVTDPDTAVGVDGPAPLRDLVLPFTLPASLHGLPAASVPVGVDEDGLPLAVQLVARPGGEGALLAAAAVLG